MFCSISGWHTSAFSNILPASSRSITSSIITAAVIFTLGTKSITPESLCAQSQLARKKSDLLKTRGVLETGVLLVRRRIKPGQARGGRWQSWDLFLLLTERSLDVHGEVVMACQREEGSGEIWYFVQNKFYPEFWTFDSYRLLSKICRWFLERLYFEVGVVYVVHINRQNLLVQARTLQTKVKDACGWYEECDEFQRNFTFSWRLWSDDQLQVYFERKCVNLTKSRYLNM